MGEGKGEAHTRKLMRQEAGRTSGFSPAVAAKLMMSVTNKRMEKMKEI